MVTTVLSAIFVLGILVFIHELGHFLAAKRSGIRVDRFSLGFPPTLIKKKYGTTEYCIGLILLGGYVKMAGENPDEEVTGSPDEFMSKSILTRTFVILAGPVMNFLLAWLVLAGIFFVNGEAVFDTKRTVIGAVSPGTPAETAGLMAGDVIISLNGTPIGPYTQLSELVSKIVEQPLTVVWLHNGQQMSATVTTISEKSYDDKGKKVDRGILGVWQRVEYRNLGIFESTWKGLSETADIVGKMVLFVRDLVTLQVSPRLIGGPVFIAQIAGQTAAMGFSALMYLLAFLSVNLAVINVLPIPVMDGGHLVFLAIEKIKGTPLTINQRVTALKIGFVFLILVIVMVTYNDIMRFISG